MSLLGSGSNYDDITVYAQEEVTDIDGNPRTRPSATGVAAKARFQPLSQSGTSSRLQETANTGFESEQDYTMRLHPSFTDELGPQSEVEWHGQRWAIYGYPLIYGSSRRTRHVVYQVQRK